MWCVRYMWTNVHKNAKILLTDPFIDAILTAIKNCEPIEVRCASVFSADGIGIPAGKKG